MSKKQPPSAPGCRRPMVEPARAGRPPGRPSLELECSASPVRNRLRGADRDEERREDGLTSLEREELRELRREIRRLRKEREIMIEAATCFARERGCFCPLFLVGSPREFTELSPLADSTE